MLLVLGVIIAAIATILSNYGSFIMKKELSNLPRIGEAKVVTTVRAFFNSRPWMTGQGIQILGSGFHNIAIALAPLSVVQPVNAAGICLLVVLAVTKLGEKASAIDWVGISTIILGVLLLGVSLVNTPTRAAAYRPVLLWLFIILMFLVAGSTLIAALVRKDERTSSFLGIGVGLLVGLTAILMKMTWTDLGNRWNEYKIGGFVFSWYFWIAIILTVISMVLFQIALQRGKAIVVVPLVTGFSNLIPIFVGFIAFREQLPKGTVMVTFRLVSILLIIGGAVILSFRRESQDPVEEGQGLEPSAVLDE